jgi:hypothetical protein
MVGLFGRKNESAFDQRETELNLDWFTRWADDIRERKGNAELRAVLEVDDDPSALATLWGKAAMVIDHDCRDYVRRYLDGEALRAYVVYYDSDQLTPWGLVSLVCSLDPREHRHWEEFIIDDIKTKLGRFGDIMVDPTIVG